MFARPFISWMLCLSLVFIPVAPSFSNPSDALDIANLAIPQSLGKIQERFKGTSDHWIIQIQDVHGHILAQENISAILDHLQAVYGVQTVAVEGSSFATSLPKSWSIPNGREKQQISRSLLDDGYLSGPEYAALFTPQPLNLIGIEEESVYAENRAAFLEALAITEKTQQKIEAKLKQLSEEKQSVYGAELLSFDRTLQSFREGQESGKFFPLLLSLTAKHSIDIQELDQVQLLQKILQISQTIEQEKLEAEASRLVSKYQSKRLGFEELIRSGKVPQEDLQYYTQIQAYMELSKLQDQMVHVAFIEQTEKLVAQIKQKLMTSAEEESLDQTSERLSLLKKLLTFKATPQDYDNLELQTPEVEAFAEENDLSSELVLSQKFYQLAKARDKVFFEKLTSDKNLSQNTAVVTGGFHTEGLTTELRQAGISYLVITPELGKDLPNESLYHELLKKDPIPSQTLSQRRRAMFPQFDIAFASTIENAKSEHRFNLVEAVAQIEKGTPATMARKTTSVSMDVEEFLSWPRDEQTSKIQTWLQAQPKPGRAILFITSQDLDEVLANHPAAADIWEAQVKSEKWNTIVLIQDGDSISDHIIGGRFVVDRVPAANLSEALQQPRIQTRYLNGVAKNQNAAIITSDTKTLSATPLLKLPKTPGALVFFRELLGIPELRALAENMEALSVITDILLDLQAKEGSLRSA